MNDRAPDVPYIVFEGERVRHEREIKRLHILAGILAAAIVLTNALWAVVLL